MHAGQRGELLVAHRLVGGEVRRDDADEVVGIAEEALRAADRLDVCERLLEPRDRVGVLPVHRHVDEHLEAEADRGRVDHGAVATDGALGLEAAKSALAGLQAEPDAIG